MVWIYGGAFTRAAAPATTGPTSPRTAWCWSPSTIASAAWASSPTRRSPKTNPGRGAGQLRHDGPDRRAEVGPAQHRGLRRRPAPASPCSASPPAASRSTILMISPPARGLFAQAASESGFGRSQPRPLDRRRKHGADFIKTLGRHRRRRRGRPRPCARCPPRRSQAPTSGIGDPTSPGPILDGVVIREGTGRRLRARPPGAGSLSGRRQQLRGQPLPRRARPSRRWCSSRLGPTATRRSSSTAAATRPRRPRTLTTLTSVIEPDRFLARQDDKVGVPAYVYYFSYVPQAQRATVHGRHARRRDRLRVRDAAEDADRPRAVPHPGRDAADAADRAGDPRLLGRVRQDRPSWRGRRRRAGRSPAPTTRCSRSAPTGPSSRPRLRPGQARPADRRGRTRAPYAATVAVLLLRQVHQPGLAGVGLHLRGHVGHHLGVGGHSCCCAGSSFCLALALRAAVGDGLRRAPPRRRRLRPA